MGPVVLILGPTGWKGGSHPTGRLSEKPIEVRRRLRKILAPDVSDALLMEDFSKEEDETNWGLFRRIISSQGVTDFIVFWPFGAKLHGLTHELGYLLTKLDAGDLSPGSVHLFVERKNLQIDWMDGGISITEKGNRTRYHLDLVDYGCEFRRWGSESGLLENTKALAEDLNSRE